MNSIERQVLGNFSHLGCLLISCFDDAKIPSELKSLIWEFIVPQVRTYEKNTRVKSRVTTKRGILNTFFLDGELFFVWAVNKVLRVPDRSCAKEVLRYLEDFSDEFEAEVDHANGRWYLVSHEIVQAWENGRWEKVLQIEDFLDEDEQQRIHNVFVYNNIFYVVLGEGTLSEAEMSEDWTDELFTTTVVKISNKKRIGQFTIESSDHRFGFNRGYFYNMSHEWPGQWVVGCRFDSFGTKVPVSISKPILFGFSGAADKDVLYELDPLENEYDELEGEISVLDVSSKRIYSLPPIPPCPVIFDKLGRLHTLPQDGLIKPSVFTPVYHHGHNQIDISYFEPSANASSNRFVKSRGREPAKRSLVAHRPY